VANFKGTAQEVPSTTTHPLKSTKSQAIHQTITKEWNYKWNNTTTTSKHLWRITTRKLSAQSTKTYNTLTTRIDITLITCLKTGHNSLKEYLYCFNIEESPNCGCNNKVIETEKWYFLTKCPKYEQKHELIQNVEIKGMKIKNLLGDAKKLKHIIEFIKRTKRFEF
jgi:hypothetical protein